MKHNYFTEVSLFIDILPHHPDALVSFWQGFYNCNGRNWAPEFFLLKNWRPHKCCDTGPKIIVQWARSTPYVGFSLSFQ